MIKRIAWVLGALLLAAVVPAQADSVPVFSTGVTSSGQPAANASLDAHYTLTFGADSVFNGPEAYVANTPGVYPFTSWMPGTSTAQWIGPRDSLAYPFGTGNYIYTTTFDLTGLNLATVVLTGAWATDNAGLDILLNGVSLGIFLPNGSDSALTSFIISSGFLPGINTLQFVVYNDTGATGLLVDISGTADPLGSSQGTASQVPEPATVLLVGSGLVGAWLRRRG